MSAGQALAETVSPDGFLRARYEVVSRRRTGEPSAAMLAVYVVEDVATGQRLRFEQELPELRMDSHILSSVAVRWTSARTVRFEQRSPQGSMFRVELDLSEAG
jgi:hypothetical protein